MKPISVRMKLVCGCNLCLCAEFEYRKTQLFDSVEIAVRCPYDECPYLEELKPYKSYKRYEKAMGIEIVEKMAMIGRERRSMK